MSKLDQFASAFKSASKQRYRFSDIVIGTVVVVTDLDESASQRFADDVKQFLDVVADKDDAEWVVEATAASDDVGDLLALVENRRPDLICTYRNLHGRARSYPFSLGAHVDVLTQATTTPVLLLPAPTEDGRLSPTCVRTQRVMVLTDHLQGSDAMIDFGVHFATNSGTLVLAHLEDDATFERYISTIGKIPSIDTDDARASIGKQLVKEPHDYIDSVRSELEGTVRDLAIEKEVAMGHRVGDCKRLIEAHSIELLVLNAKDEEQLAMHGLAYPLAIELRDTPLLML